MSPQLLLTIIELAAAVLKSRTSTNAADHIDEGLAIARIVQAGRQAYQDQTGKPLDESLIKPQEPIV